MDGFSDPGVAGHSARPVGAIRINRLEHLGREPKIDPIERLSRMAFDGRAHGRHYGAILAQEQYGEDDVGSRRAFL
jgi:hypothetical protein